MLAIEQVIASIRERNRERATPEARPILTGELGCCGVVASQNDEIERHNQNASIRAFAITFALAIHSIFEGIAIGVQSTSAKVFEVIIQSMVKSDRYTGLPKSLYDYQSQFTQNIHFLFIFYPCS